MVKTVSAIVKFNRAAFGVLLLLLLLSNLLPFRYFTAEEKVFPGDEFEHDFMLQSAADALLPLFDNMPAVPVFLTDETVIKSGTNTERGLAYTRCDNHEIPSIFVKKVFYQKNNQKQLVNALKHELTHAWLCRQRMMSGHDARFYKKFYEVGGFGN